MVMPAAWTHLVALTVPVTKALLETALSVKVDIVVCYCGTFYTFISDIDECVSEEMNDCHVNSTCVNTIGNYSCTCDEGFSGSGFECQSKNNVICLMCCSQTISWITQILMNVLMIP